MPEDQPPSMKDFGASFIEFLQNAAAQAPPSNRCFFSVSEPTSTPTLPSFP